MKGTALHTKRLAMKSNNEMVGTQRGLLLTTIQARSASIVTRATPTNALTQTGASQRVSTIGSGDASRDKLLCHRYVKCTTVHFTVSNFELASRESED